MFDLQCARVIFDNSDIIQSTNWRRFIFGFIIFDVWRWTNDIHSSYHFSLETKCFAFFRSGHFLFHRKANQNELDKMKTSDIIKSFFWDANNNTTWTINSLCHFIILSHLLSFLSLLMAEPRQKQKWERNFNLTRAGRQATVLYRHDDDVISFSKLWCSRTNWMALLFSLFFDNLLSSVSFYLYFLLLFLSCSLCRCRASSFVFFLCGTSEPMSFWIFTAFFHSFFSWHIERSNINANGKTLYNILIVSFRWIYFAFRLLCCSKAQIIKRQLDAWWKCEYKWKWNRLEHAKETVFIAFCRKSDRFSFSLFGYLTFFLVEMRSKNDLKSDLENLSVKMRAQMGSVFRENTGKNPFWMSCKNVVFTWCCEQNFFFSFSGIEK